MSSRSHTMAEQSQIIAENPIGAGLDDFRRSYCSLGTLDSLDRNDLRTTIIDLALALQRLPVSHKLRSSGRNQSLFFDLAQLLLTAQSDEYDLDRVKPLLNAVLADPPVDDALIWDQVYNAVAERSPPPLSMVSYLLQTPVMRNTSSFLNSSEHRKYVDNVLRTELGRLYAGLPGFHEVYFRGVAGLDTVSETFFTQCRGENGSPRFNDGWQGWPVEPKEEAVLRWFTDFTEKLATFAEGYKQSTTGRTILGRPNHPIAGSTAQRKMDIGFIDAIAVGKNTKPHWSQVKIPGELKSAPSADKALEAWLDLGKYSREVLAAQDTRRYVLGFTLCGSLMRVWVFDRVGGIGSERFDINKEGLQFISTVLAFLWMDDEQLGFDPTITTGEDGRRSLTITRNGQTERLIIDKMIRRTACIAGRATTCWKVHHEEDPQTPLVVKDSWQYPEREEEGELVREATAKGVINVARYYHHETVFVRGQVDDISNNVRGGLNVSEAKDFQPGRPRKAVAVMARRTSLRTSVTGGVRESRSTGVAGMKRSSDQAGIALPPPSKRTCSTSPGKGVDDTPPNRIHRRVVLRDYGSPIYTASSCSALLDAFVDCLEGHESLYKAGFLHRDISINNLLVRKDIGDSLWHSFLIDMDLGIRQPREVASGAKDRTGTPVFMSIGALFGEQHTFMNDLESFFWVLFWICIHYDGNLGRVVSGFDKWNYVDLVMLANTKKGIVSEEADFLRTAIDNFTQYYTGLIPWVNRLRREVFPQGRRWKEPNPELYGRMKALLRAASLTVGPRTIP